MKTIGAFVRIGPGEEATIIQCLNSIKGLFDKYYIGYADNVEHHVRSMVTEYVTANNKNGEYEVYFYPYKINLLVVDRFNNHKYPKELQLASYLNFLLHKVKTDLICKIDVDQVYIHDKFKAVIDDVKQNLAEDEFIVLNGYNTSIINGELKQLTVYELNGLAQDTPIIHTNKYGPHIQYGRYEIASKNQCKCRYYSKPIWYHHAKYWSNGDGSVYLPTTHPDLVKGIHYKDPTDEMLKEYNELMIKYKP